MNDQQQKIAAIDIGSNAMRLIVASADQGKMQTILTERESVRLGAEVFKDGFLTEETLSRSVEALLRFKSIIEENQVSLCRAIGTSALREAKNSAEFAARIQKETGITVDIIDGDEEARLVYLAVSETIGFSADLDLLIDLGGGSAEVTLCRAGDIIFSESLQMGTVRLINLFKSDLANPRKFAKLVKSYSKALRGRVEEYVGDEDVARCVGTGGNLETFLALRDKLFGEKGSYILREELEEILERLLDLSVEERIKQLELRADRADVIVPAAIVILQVMRAASANRIEVPRVGVREGVVYQLALGNPENDPHFKRKHLIQAALLVGRKYKFREAHAKNVAKLAIDIFEQTTELHGLDEEGRKLLEIAALLHDIGHFVSSRAHHKHSHYLIESASFPALTRKEKLMIACIARYHRKKFPEQSHSAYASLNPLDQEVVLKLSAILRLADGLDRDHTQQVQGVEMEIDKPAGIARLKISGGSDLSLDTWSVNLKAALFAHVYKLKVEIVGDV